VTGGGVVVIEDAAAARVRRCRGSKRSRCEADRKLSYSEDLLCSDI
jgi:hypothetical protein